MKKEDHSVASNAPAPEYALHDHHWAWGGKGERRQMRPT
jgi:hypothetical protein